MEPAITPVAEDNLVRIIVHRANLADLMKREFSTAARKERSGEITHLAGSVVKLVASDVLAPWCLSSCGLDYQNERVPARKGRERTAG